MKKYILSALFALSMLLLLMAGSAQNLTTAVIVSVSALALLSGVAALCYLWRDDKQLKDLEDD